MRAARFLLPVTVLAVAGCTSFTEAATGPSAPSSTTAPAPTAPSSGRPGDLAVTDEVDLGVAAADVSTVRIAEGPVVLLVGSTSTVVEGSRTTRLTGLAGTDLVLVDGDPVVVGVAADPVSGGPVLATTRPDGDAAQPVAPQTPARRGTSVFAAADGDVVHLLAEDADDLAATVLTVDPATGDVLADVDLDLGDDVTAIDLVGLAAAPGGGLVAGLDVRTSDGASTGRLVTLDGDLRQTGTPAALDGSLLALTSDGAPVTDSALGDEEGTRVSGAASTGGSTVIGLLDQPSPTVLVTADGDDPTTLRLCGDEGDALAVARTGAGTVLVAGTCDGTARLWTLG